VTKIKIKLFKNKTETAFLPRDARSAKCSIAITSHLCTKLMYSGRIRWTSSKLITRITSLESMLLGATTSAIWSKGNTRKFGWNRGGVDVLNRKNALSLKRGKIGPRLLLMTNRKLHTRFRLVPKSIELLIPGKPGGK